MDKLESVNELFAYNQPLQRQKKKKELKASRFSSLLKTHELEAGEELDYNAEEVKPQKLEELFAAIREAGTTLISSPTMQNIMIYRERIKAFTKYLMKNVLGVEEHVSKGNILKRKKYTLLKIVDKKLEDLARDFLLSQKNQLDMLARVNEINGLIVDLMS